MNILDLRKNFFLQTIYPEMRAHFKKIFAPEYLYHYSNQFVLGEIIKTKQIWLSNAFDMNDPQEITFGTEIILNLLKQKMGDDSVIFKMIENCRSRNEKAFATGHPNNVFIFSFSEKGDDLKQWIHYGNNGKGVSIEFVFSKIQEALIYDEIGSEQWLLPVYYFNQYKKPSDTRAQHFCDMLLNIFRGIEKGIVEAKCQSDQNVMQMSYDNVRFFSSFIKQDLFQDEKEWRLVINTGPGNKSIKIKTHINNMAKMVYEQDFKNKDDISCVNSIMNGPGNYNNRTNMDALEFLIREKLDGKMITINRSRGELR